jgi:hypothetical protein
MIDKIKNAKSKNFFANILQSKEVIKTINDRITDDFDIQNNVNPNYQTVCDLSLTLEHVDSVLNQLGLYNRNEGAEHLMKSFLARSPKSWLF